MAKVDQVEADKNFWTEDVTLHVPTRRVNGGYLSEDGCGWVNKVRLTREEAGQLADRLAELTDRPEPEKPKQIGDLSELEYLRSLVFELSRK